MKKQASKYYTLLLLAVLFAAPGIAAYIFYQHPNWLRSSTINKGSLLNPPIYLRALGDAGKWRIVYWSPNDCEESCLKQLDVIARVRLALGRKLYDVDQWLLLGDTAAKLTEKDQELLKEQDFHVMRLSAKARQRLAILPQEGRVYLANPDNYLILSYESTLNPNDVYKDLKLLLSTGTKSG